MKYKVGDWVYVKYIKGLCESRDGDRIKYLKHKYKLYAGKWHQINRVSEPMLNHGWYYLERVVGDKGQRPIFLDNYFEDPITKKLEML